jgi:hypothetical protein
MNKLNYWFCNVLMQGWICHHSTFVIIWWKCSFTLRDCVKIVMVRSDHVHCLQFIVKKIIHETLWQIQNWKSNIEQELDFFHLNSNQICIEYLESFKIGFCCHFLHSFLHIDRFHIHMLSQIFHALVINLKKSFSKSFFASFLLLVLKSMQMKVPYVFLKLAIRVPSTV